MWEFPFSLTPNTVCLFVHLDPIILVPSRKPIHCDKLTLPPCCHCPCVHSWRARQPLGLAKDILVLGSFLVLSFLLDTLSLECFFSSGAFEQIHLHWHLSVTHLEPPENEHSHLCCCCYCLNISLKTMCLPKAAHAAEHSLTGQRGKAEGRCEMGMSVKQSLLQ